MNLVQASNRTPLSARTLKPFAHLVKFLPHPHTCPARRLLQPGTACRAVSTAVSHSAEHVQSWAQQHHKHLQNCRVGLIKDTAVLLTAASAQSGQSLLSVPNSSWLTLEAVAKSPIGPSVASLEPWLQLALFILYGLSEPDSEWSQYLLSLPQSLDVPLLWSEDELDLLEGTQLLSTVQGYRYCQVHNSVHKTGTFVQLHNWKAAVCSTENWSAGLAALLSSNGAFGCRDFFEEQWHDLNDNLFKSAPDLFPSNQFSFERFLWAVATLRAHVHPPLQGAQVALVPLASLVSLCPRLLVWRHSLLYLFI